MNRLKKCIIAYSNVSEDSKYKSMLCNEICTKFILTLTRIWLLVWLSFPCLFADLVARVTANLQRIFTNHFGNVLIIITKFILFTNENN